MANQIDTITHRPIGQWHLSPPEVTVASNGYVLRTYAVESDSFTYTIATNVAEVRAKLREWADEVANAMRRSLEHNLPPEITSAEDR